MDLDEQREQNRNKYENRRSSNSSSSFKKYIPWAIVAVLVIWVWTGYNGLVKAEEPVGKAWANVETQYQGRLDKVKVISKIVKNAAKYEYTTLVDVVKARQIKKSLEESSKSLDKTTDKINALKSKGVANNETYRSLQQEMTRSLNSIDVVFERYPELKATEAYRDFQAQYEGIENRIGKARVDFNESIMNYNIKVRKFPSNLLANVFGFEVKKPFEADAGAENVNMDDIDISL